METMQSVGITTLKHLILFSLLCVMLPCYAQQPSPTFQATETFSGSVDGIAIIFSHSNYTSFQMTREGHVTEGLVNTEQGFENDPNATVFILNPDKRKREQMLFVRYTNGTMMMLDRDKKVIPGASFSRE